MGLIDSRLTMQIKISIFDEFITNYGCHYEFFINGCSRHPYRIGF